MSDEYTAFYNSLCLKPSFTEEEKVKLFNLYMRHTCLPLEDFIQKIKSFCPNLPDEHIQTIRKNWYAVYPNPEPQVERVYRIKH